MRLSVPPTAAMLLAFVTSACGDRGAAPPDLPLVRTVAAGQRVEAETRYTGTIRARIEADLGFRVGGKIVDRLVDPGTLVRRGQPLMRIDASDLALSADAAAARLTAAQAEAVRAAADEARLRDLVEGGATSRAAYEAALAARRSAAANLDAARSASVEAANQRRYAVLVADADGAVTDVLAQPGQVVAAGTPVVRLARAGAREAALSLPESAIAAVPRSGTATLLGRNAPIPARLREVSASADPATRTYAARYTLEGAPADLPLGATVTLAFAQATGGAARTVPLAALRDDGRGASVWIVGPDSVVRRRAVRVLRLLDESALVAMAPLARGESVVAMGAHLLRQGQRVRVEGRGR